MVPTLQLFVCLQSIEEPRWSLGFEIPTAELHHYSLFPLKWVRYLAYTLLGCQGHLSGDTKGGPVDYDLSPLNHADLDGKYYYFSEGPLFPLDLRALDDRFTDSGVSTQSSQADFREAIVERNGDCIITGYDAALCEACHILPRSKGDEYMQRCSAWRTQGAIVIDEICDPRNGFLMDANCHRLFDSGKLSFLRTPNFALQTADTPLAAGSRATATSSLILQYFIFPGPTLLHDRPHGKIVHQPVDASKIKQWPPPFLLDMVYGAAAFKRWSSPEFIKEAQTIVHSHYYDEGHQGNEKDVEATKARAAKREKRAAEAERRGQGTDVLDIVAALWQMSAKRGTGPEEVVKSKPHSEDKDSGQTSNDKVTAWLRNTNTS